MGLSHYQSEVPIGVSLLNRYPSGLMLAPFTVYCGGVDRFYAHLLVLTMRTANECFDGLWRRLSFHTGR